MGREEKLKEESEKLRQTRDTLASRLSEMIHMTTRISEMRKQLTKMRGARDALDKA